MAAALDACETLRASLAPYRPSGTPWADAVAAASAALAPLAAFGWFAYASEDAFDYATQGAANTLPRHRPFSLTGLAV